MRHKLSAIRASRLHVALLTGCTLLGICAPPSVRADEVTDLARYLPDDINAVAIVRSHDLITTPRALKENWAAQSDMNFLQGAGGIPSWVDLFVGGFLVRLNPVSEVSATAVVKVREVIDINSLAAMTHSPVDEIAGFPAIQTRTDSHVLQLAPGLLGVRRPAVRQETARWIRLVAEKRTGHLQPFLREALSETGHVVFAMNLQDAFTLDKVSTHLATQSSIPVASRERLANLIIGIRDVTLAVNVGEKNDARVVFEFNEPVGDLAPSIRPVFLSILSHLGASIDEFESGTMSADGKFAILRAQLSDESLNRIISLLTATPDSMAMPEKSDSKVTDNQNEAIRKANRTYFLAIEKMLDNLERSSRRSNNASQTALWHNTFARRIDELPMHNVDKELLAYGASVASKLRALSRSLQGQIISVNAAQGTLTYDTQFTPGWASIDIWGGIGYGQPAFQTNSNLQQVRERQAAAIEAGSRDRQEIWGMLSEERAAMQRALLQKYGQDFLRRAR